LVRRGMLGCYEYTGSSFALPDPAPAPFDRISQPSFFEFQGVKSKRCLQVRVFDPDCLGISHIDLKRFKESPVLDIVPILREIIDTRKACVKNDARYELRQCSGCRFLQDRGVDIFNAKSSHMNGQ